MISNRFVLSVASILFAFAFSNAQCPPNTFLPANGTWDNAANWSCGNVPGNNEAVLIPAGQVCTLDIVTPVLSNTIIWLYGTLYMECGKKLRLDCNSALVIWPGGRMEGACVGSKLDWCGEFLWDGGDPPVIGPASFPASALPIELVSFQGWYDGNSMNTIEWKTASETNNDFFALEKSVDGINFETFMIVEAAGTSSSSRIYSVTDDSPFIPITYYRLEQTDLDSTSTISPIISVFADRSINELILFPNPALSNSMIQMRVPQKLTGKEILVIVYDILGNELYSKVIVSGFIGDTVTAVDPGSNLKPGIYTVTGTNGNILYQQKLIIQ